MTNEVILSINNNDNSGIESRESIEIRSVRSMTCYICLENIVTMQKQFGLQNNCEHFFCFDCLSTWRRTSNIVDKDTSGRCPLCRVRSTFIAPSWRCFNNTNDKQYLINTHKLRLKRIPCRTLSRYGYCRFGHRCYYNHNRSLSTSRRSSLVNQQQQQQNLSIILQENPSSPSNDEPPRRIPYNSHRYRPY